ncbi:MAG: hypothetical protein JST16_05320 [Bdellovibrionales bacterium]|nr:hypothetical protein [Bdellovibrionales bacterium]
METPVQAKQSKAPSRPSPYCTVRVKKETRKRILSELAKANKKDFGRRVHADEILSVALTLLTPDHIKKLQEESLSAMDRLERDYRTHVAKHGPMSKDVYLGKRLSGEIPAQVASPSQQLNP